MSPAWGFSFEDILMRDAEVPREDTWQIAVLVPRVAAGQALVTSSALVLIYLPCIKVIKRRN
jgi:hypothetical protein